MLAHLHKGRIRGEPSLRPRSRVAVSGVPSDGSQVRDFGVLDNMQDIKEDAITQVCAFTLAPLRASSCFPSIVQTIAILGLKRLVLAVLAPPLLTRSVGSISPLDW